MDTVLAARTRGPLAAPCLHVLEAGGATARGPLRVGAVTGGQPTIGGLAD